jgi:tetratricopeptide (TPR) repeat protein
MFTEGQPISPVCSAANAWRHACTATSTGEKSGLTRNRSSKFYPIEITFYSERGFMAKQGIKKQTLVIAVLLSFICGFLAGAGFAIYKGGSRSVSTAATAGNTSNQTGVAGQQASEISDLETQLTATPDNFQLWTELGNLYYDTGQPEKAIKAYNRSLELHTGNANLLTDLGVMYRKVGQPKKAIEYFDRAIALDPKHEPSRLNKGIVLVYDLHEPDKAIAVWEDLLHIDPDARTASGDTVRDLIQEVKNGQGGGK